MPQSTCIKLIYSIPIDKILKSSLLSKTKIFNLHCWMKYYYKFIMHVKNQVCFQHPLNQ